MSTRKLPQELYDNLCLSLDRNGKALNNDPVFTTVKRKLESSAHTMFDGVEVSSAYLNFAVETLAHNVAVNGGKYASSLDKLVLFEIDEILNPPETPPAPIAQDESAATQPKITKRRVDLRELNSRF